MVIQITIKKQGVVTNQARFTSIEERDFWLNSQLSVKAFGEVGDYTLEEEDITIQAQNELEKSSKIQAGKIAREACEAVLDYIAGSNLDKQLTIEQITQMQATFANAESALRAGRPTYAKMFIAAIIPDGVIVTAEEKANCLEILKDY